MSYVDFLDEYLQVGVAHDEPPTIFIDALDSNIAELKDQGHFVSPHLVLDFVDREGVGPIVDSRAPVDKMMVELWVTAIYTLCLNQKHESFARISWATVLTAILASGVLPDHAVGFSAQSVVVRPASSLVGLTC